MKLMQSLAGQLSETKAEMNQLITEVAKRSKAAIDTATTLQ